MCVLALGGVVASGPGGRESPTRLGWVERGCLASPLRLGLEVRGAWEARSRAPLGVCAWGDARQEAARLGLGLGLGFRTRWSFRRRLQPRAASTPGSPCTPLGCAWREKALLNRGGGGLALVCMGNRNVGGGLGSVWDGRRFRPGLVAACRPQICS